MTETAPNLRETQVTGTSGFTRRSLPKVIRGSRKMGLAQYAIVTVRDGWGVLHDGNIKGEYATKEAAFEAAAAAASLAMGQGHEVHLSVPARDETSGSSQH
jgi:hypothetical protein